MVPRGLFTRLVDDAALFPPATAAMDWALTEHIRMHASSLGDLVGPFLCPASRVDELLTALRDDQPLMLALVLDVGGEGAHKALRATASDTRVDLVAIEVAAADLGEDVARVGANLAAHLDVRGFLEVPHTDFDEALDHIEGPGWTAAKYRTGGVTPEAYPTEIELAIFLVACAARQIPFKLTAGLHHALRHTTIEHFEAHGLLNVLVATRVAAAGGTEPEVAAVLAQRQPDALVAMASGWDDATCAEVRSALLSYGCCGVHEPLTDLAGLGLLEGTT